AEGFGAPNAIAQDHRTNLYVSDSFAGAIYTVSPSGGGKTLWKADVLLQPHGNPPFGANGVAFDRTQSFLYVANTADDRILRIAVNKDGSAGAISIFADGATPDPVRWTVRMGSSSTSRETFTSARTRRMRSKSCRRAARSPRATATTP